MTITTYAELQDAIGNFMARDEYKSSGSQAARTQEFISLVEADLNSNDDFLLSFAEIQTDLTLTAGNRTLAQPADMKAARRLVVTSPEPARYLLVRGPDGCAQLPNSGCGSVEVSGAVRTLSAEGNQG